MGNEAEGQWGEGRWEEGGEGAEGYSRRVLKGENKFIHEW